MSLKERLAMARQSLTESMNVLFKRGPEVDDDFWDELEETLILADMGAQAASEIVERLRDTATRKALPDAYAVLDLLAETIDSVLGTHPSTLPEFVLRPIRALGGRQFLVDHLWILGLVLVGLNLINGVFTYLKGRLNAVASENIAMTLRENLYEHLQRLPFAYHVKAETGDLIQRCTSDV